MFAPLVGRHLIHLMVIFYTALVCTTIFQSTLFEMAAPPIKNEWLSPRGNFIPPVSRERTSSKPEKRTLALLYPPGIVGGYRNQVMRFVGFLHYAKIHDVQGLLLPTLLWTTTYQAARDEKRFYPIPMATLFDVEHWNTFLDQLPPLVDTIDGYGDCWHPNDESIDNLTFRDNDPPRTFVPPTAKEVLRSSALLNPARNISTEILTGALNVQTRKLDLLPLMENCTNPLVYGGGKGAGRLWNDYIRLPKGQPGVNASDPDILETTKLISLVSKALRPAKIWRDIAHSCVRDRQWGSIANARQQGAASLAPYIALHARVEVDMLIHRCSKTMEKNLTKIFNMVESFKEEKNLRYQPEPLQGIFIAVSRRGMLHPTKEEWVQSLLRENWEALTSSTNRASEFFECGEKMMQNWYSTQSNDEDDHYGSLLPSILNFYIATQATVFIGVAKSSWSTDVWTTRYYQGKGDSNFEYTPDGIFPVPNGGLPQPHGNCV